MNTNTCNYSADFEQFISKVDELNDFLRGIEQADVTDIILSELNTIRKIIDSYSLDRKSSAELGDKVNNLSTPVQNQNLSDLVPRIDGYQKSKGENSSFHQNLAVKTEVGSTMLTQSAELEIFMLGKFSAYQNNQLIKHWPNCKSKQLFKYLVLHRGVPTHKEVLMDLFWPNLSEKSARNNLNVSICGLRNNLPRPLSGKPHIIYQSDCYFINPEIDIWVDVEMFDNAISKAGKECRSKSTTNAISAYKDATEFYQGELLAEDRYDEWIQPVRQKYRESYLTALHYLRGKYTEIDDLDAVITTCLKVITTDPLEEETHCCLMKCYSKVGKRHLAVLVYHEYEQQLINDLGIKPGHGIQQLLFEIKRGDSSGLRIV